MRRNHGTDAERKRSTPTRVRQRKQYRYNLRHPVRMGAAGMMTVDAFITEHRTAIKAGEEVAGAVRKFSFFALF